VATEPASDPVVRILRRVRPLGSLPVTARYGLTCVFVAICFGINLLLAQHEPYPYIAFFPAILAAAFLFDRGSGYLATGLSTGAALYFFVEPIEALAPPDVAEWLSVLLFAGIGMLTAALIETLRLAIDAFGDSEARMARSMNLLEAVIEGTPDPIYVKDREGRYVRSNSVAARTLGVSPAELEGRRDRDFLGPEEVEAIESTDRMVMESRSSLLIEERFSVAGQGPRWFLSSKAPWYGPDGKVNGVIGISRDIEERKKAEDSIRQASRQKDLLLYDINHRVKNHLQSVMATLSMSRRRMPDDAAREAIDATVSRLSVLARVYDRLHLRPGSEAMVGTRDFVEGLCKDLGPALVGDRPVRLEVRVVNDAIEIARAVSLGLVINEALTNALKHAFPDGRAGTVAVELTREDGMFRLEVRDDGVGRAAHSAGNGGDGTGTRLIHALAQQLGATLEMSGPPGAGLVLRMPAE
jgi:PAS domain S-box-containing protein